MVTWRSFSRGAAVAVAAAACAVELWGAAVPASKYVRIGYRNLRAPTPLTRDADLDPLALYISTATLVRARQTIPPSATYTVAFGNDPPVASPGSLRTLFRLWLLPRRYVPRIREAQWVVTFHRSSESLGVRYAREIGLSLDANAVQVAR